MDDSIDYMKDKSHNAKDGATRGFEEAMEKVGEKYGVAKESTKYAYETAKKKASQVAGEIRDRYAEL
jgi:hypothetical protein